MIKKFLAKLGKGAASVDLQFENRPYQIHEAIQGEVILRGGEVDQKVNQLAVKLIMKVNAKNGQSYLREVDTVPLTGAFTISKKEEKRIPFHYSIPSTLPVTRGFVSYYFDTHLDIEGGVDRKDLDHVTVAPSKEIQSIFNALFQMGFREKAASGNLDQYGQEFEFFPAERFTEQIKEIELRFAYRAEGIQVWMEVDCRAGFREVETKQEFLLSKEQLENEEQLTTFLEEKIDAAVQDPERYRQPFSYRGHHQSGSGLGEMVGGLAVGVLGGMLISEMMEGFGVDEMMEEAEEVLNLNFDEEEFDLADADIDFGDFDDE